MALVREAGVISVIDAFDRVLDKGIVIDAWFQVSLAIIDLFTIRARVIVASIETYLAYAHTIGAVPPGAVPAPAGEAKRLD